MLQSGRVITILKTHVFCPHRAHLNDIENILPFLFLGAVYSMMGPSLAMARLHFLFFTCARGVHTITYLGALRAPTRSVAYILAQIPCVSMAVQILIKVAAHAWTLHKEKNKKSQDCQCLCNIIYIELHPNWEFIFILTVVCLNLNIELRFFRVIWSELPLYLYCKCRTLNVFMSYGYCKAEPSLTVSLSLQHCTVCSPLTPFFCFDTQRRPPFTCFCSHSFAVRTLCLVCWHLPVLFGKAPMNSVIDDVLRDLSKIQWGKHFLYLSQ